MRPLGELEAVIMDYMWSSSGPATVRQVLDALDRDPAPAYNTVLTVMDHLYRKGLLIRTRAGRAHVYSPTQARADYMAGAMHELLDDSGDPSATLMRFIDSMTSVELGRLKRLLDD